MPEAPRPLCWICRTSEGTTREHLIKRTDLKSLFEKSGRGGPYYFSDVGQVNKIVQGLKSNTLKSPVLICAECNGSRTQDHDLAWEWMSNWLRAKSALRVGETVRPNRIFRYDTHRHMLGVHLYFVKLFGGMIAEGPEKEKQGVEKIPIDITPFADAIMRGRPHKEVYLQFGRGDGSVGRSSLFCYKSEDGKSVKAVWVHRVGPVAVNVLFLQGGVRWDNLRLAWNPNKNLGSRQLRIVDTRVDLEKYAATKTD
jgi:hypothetical protein